MKKLGKLEINSEKIMKNEELVRLRGGYDACTCICFTAQPENQPLGYLASETGNCTPDCDYVWPGAWGFCGGSK